MHAYQRQRPAQHHVLRFFALLLGVVVLFGVSVVVVRGAWNMYGKFDAATHASAAAKQELETLTAREASVALALANLSTPRGIEAQVRERFGVVKPGEGEIRLVRGQVQSATETTQKEERNIFVNLFRSLTAW